MKYDSTGREVVTSPGANPTGTVGLTAVNGTLATCIRSDGAPPLSQAIAPTWTAIHAFTLNSKNVFTFAGTTAVTSLTFGNSTDLPQHTMNGNLEVANNVISVGRGASGFGGSLRYTDDSGTSRWLAGLLGSAGATSWYLYNLVGGKVALGVDQSAGAITAITLGNATDNPSYTLAGAHNGASGGNVASGTYTPTLTAVSNSSALVASVCQWMRVGNVVTVSGYFTVTTSGTPATWGVSLPVASNFTAINQCNGAAVSPGSAVYAAIYITADATNDRAQFQAVTGLTTAAVSFTFTYVVL